MSDSASMHGAGDPGESPTKSGPSGPIAGPGAARPGEPMMTLRSGGWVLVLAAVIGVFITLYVIVPALRRVANRPPGDGATPSSYGFTLADPTIDLDGLVAAQLHRDMAAPLVDPDQVDHAWVTNWNSKNRGKYLVDSDVVVGVSVGEESRAYPLAWVAFHEVVNDTVGGTPVLVVISPTTRTFAAYDRTVDGAGREFGTSGLIHENSMLLYERRRGPDGELVVGDESLWDPVTGIAVTGDRATAGATLRRMPMVVTHYGDWRAVHPETTVAARNESLVDIYTKTKYDRYWMNDTLLYPLSTPPPGPLAAKALCLILPGAGAGGVDLVVPAEAIDVLATGSTDPETGEPLARPRWKGRPDHTEEAPPRRWFIGTGEDTVVAEIRTDPEAYTLRRADGTPLPHIQTMWLAWHRTGRPVQIVDGGVLEAGASAGEPGAATP